MASGRNCIQKDNILVNCINTTSVDKIFLKYLHFIVTIVNISIYLLKLFFFKEKLIAFLF